MRESLLLVLEIIMWNSVTNSNARLRVTNTHWIYFDPNYAIGDTEKPLAAGKHSWVLFTNQAYIHKIRGIPI